MSPEATIDAHAHAKAMHSTASFRMNVIILSSTVTLYQAPCPLVSFSPAAS